MKMDSEQTHRKQKMVTHQVCDGGGEAVSEGDDQVLLRGLRNISDTQHAGTHICTHIPSHL